MFCRHRMECRMVPINRQFLDNPADRYREAMVVKVPTGRNLAVKLPDSMHKTK